LNNTASGAAPAVDIRKVVKRYGEVTALKGVTFDIGDAEFFTLLGPSGCGKTTLLRCIAGFEDVSDGAIFLYGREIETLPPNMRPVNTVFQHYALFPHMTVLENVSFGLKMRGTPAAETRRRALEMLDLVQLSALAGRRPAQLSGGQQQRVALARALAPAPKVLLLTSRSRRWTSSCARRCGWSSSRSRKRRASPSSSSPTTRKRR